MTTPERRSVASPPLRQQQNAMINAKVISVNPSVKTRGELNISSINIEPLTRSMSSASRQPSGRKQTLNLLFGINSGLSSSFSTKMMSVRMIAGIVITAMSVMSISGQIAGALPASMSWVSLVLGASILFGCFTRVISCIGALTFGIAFLSTLSTTGSGLTLLTLAAASLIFMVLGPGKYSADLFIRHSLHRLYRNANRYDPERNPDNLDFDYNAFGSVDRKFR